MCATTLHAAVGPRRPLALQCKLLIPRHVLPQAFGFRARPLHASCRHPQPVHRLLRQQGAHARPELVAGPCQRPDAPVRQLGHGPVQGRVPRARQAPLQARDHLAAERAGGRQAQRPRERRLHRAASHVLRDARQLQLRRLLQARRDPLRVGAPDAGLQAAAREAVGDRLHRRRRGVRPLDEGHRRARRARGAHRRQQGRQVRERQLLADGRHRALRAVLGNLLRPRPRGVRRAAGLAGRRTAIATSRSGTSCSCSSTAEGRRRRVHDDAAAEALRRHGHGPRAARSGAAARALELRDRSLRRA